MGWGGGDGGEPASGDREEVPHAQLLARAQSCPWGWGHGAGHLSHQGSGWTRETGRVILFGHLSHPGDNNDAQLMDAPGFCFEVIRLNPSQPDAPLPLYSTFHCHAANPPASQANHSSPDSLHASSRVPLSQQACLPCFPSPPRGEEAFLL